MAHPFSQETLRLGLGCCDVKGLVYGEGEAKSSASDPASRNSISLQLVCLDFKYFKDNDVTLLKKRKKNYLNLQNQKHRFLPFETSSGHGLVAGVLLWKQALKLIVHPGGLV